MQLTGWIASSVAVASCYKVILVPLTASIDEPLTDPCAGVVVIAIEQTEACTSHCWKAADVHTSYAGASYRTTACARTVGSKI